MSTVYYVGAFSFPEGDAAAARVLGIGKALRETGCDVIYGGWEKEARSEDKTSDGSSYYEGFRYYSQNEFRQAETPAIQRLRGYLCRGRKTVRWLAAMEPARSDLVIAYGGTSMFLMGLKALCDTRGSRLVADCVEWYSPRHLVGGSLGLVRWDDECRMRFVNRRIGKVIAVSTYLERYYRDAGCLVVRMPPLIDYSDQKWGGVAPCRLATGPLRLGYAGTPGKKDLLGNVLRGLYLLRRAGRQVELHLIGPSRQDVAVCLEPDSGILAELGDAVVLHGRIEQSRVPAILRDCDFTVLLRPNERYAQAGFPTKLVESLATGVPVVVNPTSDIALYIHDGEEGILLHDPSAESFVEGVDRILRMPGDKWMEMRSAAKRCALRSFDYRNYVAACHELVSGPSQV